MKYDFSEAEKEMQGDFEPQELANALKSAIVAAAAVTQDDESLIALRKMAIAVSDTCFILEMIKPIES